MKTVSASRAEPDAASPAASGPARPVLVWDAPVRVFHWLMVFSFTGAYLTAESERWRLLHVTLGYTMAGLVVFRLIWGLLGSRHARFTDFVRGPAAVAQHLSGLLRGRLERHVGHNPLGAVAIVAMLLLTMVIAASGWAVFNDVGGDRFEGVHEFAANAMLAVIGVHIAGVLLASWLGHENLVGAMVTGRKLGRPEDGIRSAWRSVALLMVAAVLGFWWLQWQESPATLNLAGTATTQQTAEAPATTHKDRDKD